MKIIVISNSKIQMLSQIIPYNNNNNSSSWTKSKIYMNIKRKQT